MEQQIDLNTDTLSGDVRSAIMDKVRGNSMMAMLTEAQQRAFAHEIDELARYLVREAVNLIAADGMPVIRAKCGEVKRRKDGDIEAKFGLKGDDEQRHQLFDATNSPILVIVADHERYIGEQAPEPIDPDQPGLLDAAD
jgi:hypothetical protein